MQFSKIDAEAFSKMFLAGAKNLEAQKEIINELNVFPVPDGDTGTNMTLTIMSAAREVSNIQDMNMETLAKAISSGSLRGARGNSGVILSQLLRGFTKVIKEYEEIDVSVLAQAAVKATETAYKAVMKPKEGTILTVAKGIADKAEELAADSSMPIGDFLKACLEHGEYVLSTTPEMLPVLKEAGVVDSGGQGLIEVIKGGIACFNGEEIDLSSFKSAPKTGAGVSAGVSSLDVQANIEIKFGYCTEFIVVLEKEFTQKDEIEFKAFLESIGDSIVCVADDEVVKVHVHTNDPGLAIQKGLSFGSLTSMKIDNMREEHQEKLFKMSQGIEAEAVEVSKNNTSASKEEPETDNHESINEDLEYREDDDSHASVAEGTIDNPKKIEFDEPPKEMGFVAVSVGEGLDAIFKGLGVDYIIKGGQTMNPSTDDMLNAIGNVNAKTVFILPNNKNIILAANQAQYLVEDKEIIVIPTKTVPQGITALINYMPDSSVEENTDEMTESIKSVKTGQVTYAVRDTVINGMEIHQGNIMGIGDHDILSVGSVVENTAIDMIDKMIDDDSELICIYYGEEVDEEVADEFLTTVEEKYPDCDVEIHSGGQPIYYYIISVE